MEVAMKVEGKQASHLLGSLPRTDGSRNHAPRYIIMKLRYDDILGIKSQDQQLH